MPRATISSGLIAGLAAAFLSAPAPAYACEAVGERVFEVLRKGRPIGSHIIRRSTDGDQTRVEIEIDLRIGLGPLTLFRYEHRNTEVWRSDRLVELRSETNDNGERYQLRAEATPNGLEVEGASGSYTAPLDLLPTSYWNPETLTRRAFLDTQRGGIVNVNISDAGADEIRMGTQRIPGRRSEVSGDLNLSVWYTDAGELGRIAFDARGAEIDYRVNCDGA